MTLSRSFAARKRAMLDEIGAAIGKTIEDAEATLPDEPQTLEADDDTPSRQQRAGARLR